MRFEKPNIRERLCGRHAGGEDGFCARGDALALTAAVYRPSSDPLGVSMVSQSTREEGFSRGRAEQRVVGVVLNPGAAAASHKCEPVTCGRDAVDRDVGNVVTLESMSMTCRFRFWRPVSVLKGAKAASACPRV